MTCLAIPEVMSSCGRDLALARRRLQQKGDLFNQGGMWKLRWHEDKIGPDGERMRGWSRAVHIGPSAGAGKLTEKEARRLGSETRLGDFPFKARHLSLCAALRGHPRQFRGTALSARPCGAAEEEREVPL